MTGVILLNLGGPDSLDAVRPFLCNLFSDRDIIRLGPPLLQKPLASLIVRMRLQKVRAAYARIGGRSPLPAITFAQAKALEDMLNKRVPAGTNTATTGALAPFRVYTGMRYWHPLIEDTVAQMYREGIGRVLALSLYPHYSVATTGSSVKSFRKAASRYPSEYRCVSSSWFDHPGYIAAVVESIRQGISLFSEKPTLLFSAHSLPQKFIDAGDPYDKEIRGTIVEVMKKIGGEWHLSYQSKTGPVKWLEPTTEHMLHTLARKGVRSLLIVPISFVSDHIETLYEIDILYRNLARDLDMRLERTESLNTSPLFIEALADIAFKEMAEAGWTR
ncbi:MAG: ferrochelatase [Nitrospirales bacterium]|nr:ferrochelatase [Nitrospirales bacterium]